MKLQLLRTDSENVDFQTLVHKLDQDLKIRDGDEHAFFAQFNKIDLIRHVVVAYDDQQALGCGAIKEYSEGIMEVKRMYVAPECRGKGIATMVLKELEKWSFELNFTRLILETGIKQPEAIGLYTKNEYTKIPNYGQYENVESSICFKKYLSFRSDN